MQLTNKPCPTSISPTCVTSTIDLFKGSKQPENISELPQGLIGLYEDAFYDRSSAVDRQKLLRRFAIWALLKTEVSAQFVTEVLD